MTDAALTLRNISKTFGATRALVDVDFTVRRGEVHALLGENGSGKSTLIKVLAGVHEPAPGGTLAIGEREVDLPLAAGAFHQIGLSFVHQDLGLARELTVVENLVGGAAKGDRSRWRIDWRTHVREAREMLRSYGADIDPRSVVDTLPPVGQALVAIARAAEELKQFRERTGATTSVLVLDEPTVFLPETELEALFELIRTVVASGSSVIFISHDLAAVRAIADHVTVLRDGRVAASAAMADVTDDDIIEFIVGPAKSNQLHTGGARLRDVAPANLTNDAVAPALSVSGLRGGRLTDLDFELRRGEILGFAGLLGSGAEDIPYLLFGARPAIGGTANVAGTSIDVTRQQPAAAVALGLSLIPADRQRDGIAREIDVSQNMMSLVLGRFRRRTRLNNGSVRAAADQRAERFDVRPRTTSVPIGTLSGGNAQKVVLAKWLEIDPSVLLLHEPTQGVDIAARSQIYRTIADAADNGMSVVWVSNDHDELATMCDRVIVMSNGRRTATLTGTDITPEAITAGVFVGARPGDADRG